MKIEKLRMRGFIGIQRGLGLDEITIDFSGISGLIAFEGMNGTGKSTILENLHPYNQLASRDGALYHHVCRRDSEKELSFTYAGNHYRTLLKIDCDSGKSEGFIWKDGQSEVNGKISAYADYIRNLLGSPTLFFSSVFCAQNSKKISDMTTGQLKCLFAEFLRLDRLTGYEETAKQCGNVLGGSLGQLDARLASLNERLSGKNDLQNDAVVVTAQATDLEAKRDNLKHHVFTIQNRIDELKEVSAQNAVNIQRKQDMVNNMNRCQTDFDTWRELCEKDLSALRAEYSNLSSALSQCEKILNQRDTIMRAANLEKELTATIEGLTIEIDKLNEQGTGHQELIHGMEMALQVLEGDIHTLNNDSTLKSIKEGIIETDRKIKDQEQTIINLQNDFHIACLESDIESAETRRGLLDRKGPACAECEFVADAVDAVQKLPGLQKELAECRVKRDEAIATAREILDGLREKFDALVRQEVDRVVWIADEKKKYEAKIVESERAIKAEKLIHATRNSDLALLRVRIVANKTELQQQKELAALLPQVHVAEERKADLEKRIAEITDKATDTQKALNAKEIETHKTINDYREILAGIDKAIDQDADAKLSDYQKEMNNIETDLIPGIDKDIQETREKSARIQADLSRIEEAEKELLTVQAEKEHLTREISEWAYLRNACSKNGLQALEIDGAAPLIVSFANDMLINAFGQLYTLKIRTQDDDGKETFEILTIWDDGSEVPLENLSGGEKVWGLKALRLGMTMLSKEKSGRNFQSFFADEEDGALDVENARNFIKLYKAFMATADFKTGFYISHKPDCRGMADNILAFEYGKVPEWR